MATFPTLLRRFEYVHNGQPVDKALVIRDCDRKPIDEVRQKMLDKLGNRRFSFPVELCVVRRCTETWLMADENAIGEVALQRGGRRIPRVNEALEEIVDAKLRFVRCLSDGKLTYGPRVLGEIAERINIQSLRDRLPSFAPFERQVNR